MENTNLKGLVVDGQPQGLGNKMVTYDGLSDFLAMLKYEIPRMGLNNSIAPEAKYSCAFGEGNTLQAFASYSFVTGQGNTLGSRSSCIIGRDNTILGDTENFIIGADNDTTDGNNVILGYSNSGLGNNFIIGHSNDFRDCNHNFIIGNSNTPTGPAVENTLILGRHLTISANEQVWLGCYNKPESSAFFGIGNGNGDDYSDRSNLLYATRKGEFYIPNGVLKTAFTFDETVSLNSTLALQKDNSMIKDDLKFNNGTALNQMIYERGFLRAAFAPYYQNEALWTVKSDQNYYAINFRPATDLIPQDSDFSLKIPEEIRFYAGKGTVEDNWANLKCGDVNSQGKVEAQTIETTTSIKCGSVSISPDEITTNKLKINSLDSLYLSEFSFTNFTSDKPGNAGIYLVRAQFAINDWTYYTNTGIIIVDNDGQITHRRTVLFSVNDSSDKTYRVFVDASPNGSPACTVWYLTHKEEDSVSVGWAEIATDDSVKCVFIPLFVKE